MRSSAALGRIEQPFVFHDRVAIGHAGDVVGDGARAAGLSELRLQLLRRLSVLGRQQLRAREERYRTCARITVCALFVMRSTR